MGIIGFRFERNGVSSNWNANPQAHRRVHESSTVSRRYGLLTVFVSTAENLKQQEKSLLTGAEHPFRVSIETNHLSTQQSHWPTFLVLQTALVCMSYLCNNCFSKTWPGYMYLILWLSHHQNYRSPLAPLLGVINPHPRGLQCWFKMSPSSSFCLDWQWFIKARPSLQTHSTHDPPLPTAHTYNEIFRSPPP